MGQPVGTETGNPRYGANTYSYMLDYAVRETLVRLAALGFTDFEVMMHQGHLWPAEANAQARRDFRRHMEANGLRLVSANMPNLDLNIASTTPEMRAYSLGILESIIALAGEIGAEGVVIGPGKPNPLMPAPRETLESHFFHGLERLAPLAAKGGTALWIENMPFAFMPNAGALVDAIEAYGDPSIGVVYDLANAHFIGEDLSAGLARAGRRLRLVHISDTGRERYRHAPLGEGTLPLERIPALLSGVGYAAPLMLEIISDDPDRHLVDSRARLQRLQWSLAPTVAS